MNPPEDIKNLLHQISTDATTLQQLPPRRFEELVAELLASFGWNIRLTPPSRDGGHDILGVTKDSTGLESTWVVECKKWTPSKKVGIDVARALYGVKSDMGVSNALLVTTSGFTQGAKQFAESKYDLQLVDKDTIAEWARKYVGPTEKRSYLEDRQFYSCFISYSHKDERFAEQLNAELRARGIRVWYAPEDMLPGAKLHEEIDRAITDYDRLIVVLSKNSMNSEWVKTEIRKARSREVEEGTQVLFPIALVSMEDIKAWSVFDPDTGKDLAVEVREYFIPDFSNWRDSSVFNWQVERVVMGLRDSNQVSAKGDITKRRRDICTQIRAYLDEVSVVFEDTLSLCAENEDHKKDISYGEEQLRRWKARVLRFLDQNVSDVDVQSFLRKSSTIGGGFSIEHFVSSYETHRHFLEALLNEIEHDHAFPIKQEPKSSGQSLPTNPPFTYKGTGD